MENIIIAIRSALLGSTVKDNIVTFIYDGVTYKITVEKEDDNN